MSSGLMPKRLASGRIAGRSTKRPVTTRGHRHQHERHGNAGAQQEDEEKDAAGALGESLDAGVKVDAIDRVVAQECHGDTDENEMRERPARASQWRA